MVRSSRRDTTAAAEELRDRRARRQIAYVGAASRLLGALYPYVRAIILVEVFRGQAAQLIGRLLGS
jgi:hypothetical protein